MKTITHQPFLAQVMQRLSRYAPKELEQLLCIFPTQLSIDYFQQLLNEIKGQHPAVPICLTLHRFILTHSNMEEAHPFDLVRDLHALTNQILDRQTSFEQFYPVGMTLLNDFDCLDQYLIDASVLSVALMRQKELTLPLEVLPPLYQTFTQSLIKQGKGYKGLCYRIASGKNVPETIAAYQKIIFVGFNLLSPAEEQFIMQCASMVPVEFFWDVDPHYLDNEINVAGYYLRKHRQKKCFQASFPTELDTYLSDVDKKIVITEMSATATQIQTIIDALQEKTPEGKSRLALTQTAIVVSGTYLLIPLLDKLSSLSIPLHFRLLYPLNATVMYTLVERLMDLWAQCAGPRVKQEICNNLASSLVLFRPFVGKAMQAQINVILQWIPQYASNVEALQYNLGPFSLWLHDDNRSFSYYIHQILTFMDNHFMPDHDFFLDLNRTALRYILEYLESFVEMASAGADCSIPFFLNALNKNMMLFYQHNPLTGLYIVDVTESHNLDFEHVFFLNMSEGNFPPLCHNDSFLPYSLRSSFKFPLVDKVAESVTAYGFYRLLQRAQHIYCSYAKQTNLGCASERSRLLLQLSFDSKLKIIQKDLPVNFSACSTPVITIEKDDKVMQLLEKFLVKEIIADASLTPAALISYLSCPLQFYFAYVLQLKQTVLLKDREAAIQLGTLFHNVMERLYRPFVGMQMDASSVVYLKSKMKTEVHAAVATLMTTLGNADTMLLTSLLEKFLDRVLELDYADSPFTLLGIEMGKKEPMVGALALDTKRKVVLSGIIDRIDMKGDAIRIIDYKTGASNSKISSMEALFDSTGIRKNKANFQVVFYAWLFKSIYGADYQKSIMPYLINARELFSASYVPGIFIQRPGNTKQYGRMEDMVQYEQAFEEGLLRLLLEIFDPATPFIQTEDREVCAYCPYVRICQRD